MAASHTLQLDIGPVSLMVGVNTADKTDPEIHTHAH